MRIVCFGDVHMAFGMIARLGPVLAEADLAILKEVPRDEHGNIRLAEVPLAKVLRNAVTDSLAKRGVKIASGWARKPGPRTSSGAISRNCRTTSSRACSRRASWRRCASGAASA